MARTDFVSPSNAGLICRWASRGLELLWLLMVLFVPLAFLHRDYVLSEAVIAYVEVPKIALLRVLAGLMVVLWLIEWGVQGRFMALPLAVGERYRLKPSVWFPPLVLWLRDRPARWLVLAVWLYLFTTLLSTVLSGSFTISLWGEVPGQDGHATYTVLSYLLLFAVISTHLKTKAQLWRLLGVVAAMGTLVGAYAIFQHYGMDFFDLTEQTGGGLGRVTSFMGNTIFAAAVMCMTIPITLMLATNGLRDMVWTSPGLGRDFKKILLALGLTAAWAALLAVQLLGITFTFSRGPWVGTIIGVISFLVLVGIFAGRGALARAAIVGGLTAILAVTFLQLQDSISVLNQGRWFGAVIAIGGVLGVLAIIVDWRRLGRGVVALGVLGAIAAAVLVLPPLVKGALTAGTAAPTAANVGSESTSALAAERFSSISTNVRSGIVGGRATHWKVSWVLIRDRPWFEFDDLNLRWLRPLVGYGPDLFRFTYLLKSPAEGSGMLPLEPDHAHNFFIQQTVEQGFLGLISSLGLFASVFLVAGYLLIWRRASLFPVHRLVLIGLLAMFFGRFVEMQFGLTKVSDSTVLWALLAVFVALPSVMQGSEEPTRGATAPSPAQPGRTRRSRRGSAASTSVRRSYDWRLFLRLALVAWIIGGVGMLMWLKGVNYVRAAMVEAEGLRHSRDGDLQATLVALDRAVQLAPDVPAYYNNRARVYLSYQLNEDLVQEQECSAQKEIPYKNCLAFRAFESSVLGAQKNDFYYRSWLELGNAATNLTLDEQALGFYERSLALLPNAWTVANELAGAYIRAGRPEAALRTLDTSLELTKDSELSARARFLQGLAYRDSGDLNEAANSLETGLRLTKASSIARPSLELLSEIYSDLGVDLSIPYYDEVIRNNPDDVFAFYNRGHVHNQLGNYAMARQDFNRVLALGLHLAEVYGGRGTAILKLGEPAIAARDIERAIADDPQNSKWYALRALLGIRVRDYDAADNDLDVALRLDPESAEAHQYRGQWHHAQGEYQPALLAFDKAIKRDPQSGAAFVDRGKTYLKLGRIDEAIKDFDQAVQINPAESRFLTAVGYSRLGDLNRAVQHYDQVVRLVPVGAEIYNGRGLAFLKLGQLQPAIEDFGIAIGFRAARKITAGDDVTAAIYGSRGLAYYALGKNGPALADFDRAVQIMRGHAYLNPQYSKHLFHRARLYSDLGRYQEAVKDLDQAIEMLDRNRTMEAFLDQGPALARQLAEYHQLRGTAYIGLKQHENAVASLGKAINLAPGLAEAYSAIATAYEKLGESLLAAQNAEKAASLKTSRAEQAGANK